jgi:DNA helicase HerA-like ATPase
MPRLPRPPRPPRSLRPPRLPPLNLAPIRSAESVALDDARTPRQGLALPPFVRFDRFIADWDWRQGEHVTTIGPTGSGKTVLNRHLLRRRDFVIVLGVKKKDRELYGAYEREGYELVRRFDPEPPPDAAQVRLLFVPQTDKHGTEGRQARARRFRQALNDIYDVGGWTVYADDVQYMADQLRLAPELEELWILGRSEGVSLVASSQEPVDIPLNAYGMATHLFLFRNDDLVRSRRMAELTGVNREVAQHTLLQLPDHEFLYINKRERVMLRSKVLRPAEAP